MELELLICRTTSYEEKGTESKAAGYDNEDSSDYVHVGLGGVHVKDKDGSEVHVGWDGIHVDDRKRKENVHIDRNGVYVNGEKYERQWMSRHIHFPFGALIVCIYLIAGAMFNAWHPAWLLFMLIPLWYSFAESVKHRNAHLFAYPVLTALLYLCIGFFMGLWHPGWILFLTIPIYYSVVAYIQGSRKEQADAYESSWDDGRTED